ncbi:hypothetical protein NDU88_009181 [Pleurodeles waltl]|uniref:Uncharacterized protein n=1 Tax=Pleurodeles waltl TaxID=8319 RepID=A0AAV7RVG3_PLEWA|nr:hypothetical protein NDU88_009181 [Pleurodeles waltl]
MYNARGVKKRCRSYSAAKRIVEYAVSRVYISKKELAIYYYRDRLFANPRMSRKEKTVKRVREHTNITGVSLSREDHTISLNAHDVIVALDDLLVSLTTFLEVAELFGEVVIFQRNIHKT